MAQFDDLPDDCLRLLLDLLSVNQLMKMRLNKRLKQLATEMMKNKTKAIALSASTSPDCLFSDCSHLGSITRDQVLLLFPFVDEFVDEPLRVQSKKDIFKSILSNFPRVKSVNCDVFELPRDYLLEAVKHCHTLECLKFGKSVFTEKEWNRVLYRVGCQIKHLVKKCNFASAINNLDLSAQINPELELKLLQTVVLWCRNISHLYWWMDCLLTYEHVKAFKQLPKACRIEIRCQALADNIYEDVVDELDILTLNWSAFVSFGSSVKRLSSLKFETLKHSHGPFHGVKFDTLKKLEFNSDEDFHRQSIDCLVSSQFPALEEFCFNTRCGLTEDDYSALFQRMASVKQLTIECDFARPQSLPRSAIQRLDSLESIYLQVFRIPRNLNQSEQIFQLLKPYVDIILLKKLTLRVRDFIDERVKETLEDVVQRLKMRQNHVEIELIVREETQYNIPNFLQLEWSKLANEMAYNEVDD